MKKAETEKSIVENPSGAIRLKKPDLLLIVVLLIVGAGVVIYTQFMSHTGNVVQIRVDGDVKAEYPLDSDIDVILGGVDGGTNHLIIQDGQAWFSEASCPDGLCVGMGKISKSGQSIICLPNRVTAEIIGETDDSNGRTPEKGNGADKPSVANGETEKGIDGASEDGSIHDSQGTGDVDVIVGK
jgi:hypothetical protein